MKFWSLQEANARFSKLLNACEQDGPQLVTKSGTETAVLISVEEWLRWNAARLSLKRLLLAREARCDDLAIASRVEVRHRAAPCL